MLVNAFEFAWIADKIPCGDTLGRDQLTAKDFLWPFCSWLVMLLLRFILTGSHSLPPPSPVPNRDSSPPPPPPPQSHLYQAVIDPFLFSPSWYLGLPIGTPHDAVSIRRRHTSASSNGPSLGTNFIVCTGGDSTCELKLFGNLNCNPCCYFYWTSTLP